MAVLSDYVSGTISLTNGSVDFTGTGTGWQLAQIREGDTIFYLPGTAYQGVIAEITSNVAGKLARAWEGPDLTDVAYRIRILSDGSRSTSQSAMLRETLGNGNNLALAGLAGSADQVIMFTGPAAMTTVPKSSLVSGADYDVQVDDLAARATYDGQAPGFSVLVADVGDGRSAIYSKASNASADWTDPAYVTGPVGETPDVTIGTVTTGAPGTHAEVTATPVTGGVELDFTIPAGEGFSFEGAYNGVTAYVEGDVVRDNGSSWIAIQPTTGNAPPIFPVTINSYWALLASKGQDGTGTGDMVGPVSAVNERIAVYDGATGKLLKDGGKTIAQILAEAIPAGYDDLQFTVSQIALAMADALNVAQFLGSSGNRLADSFDALTYVDVAGGTNLDTGTAGLLKPTIAVSDTLASQSLTTDGFGFAGFTIKQLIGAGVLTTSGSKVRVSVQASASGITMSGMYIGHRDTGGDGWDALSLTQVTFAGNGSLTLGANATATSDWITFALNEAQDVIVSFHISANEFKRATGLNTSNFNRYYKAAASEAATANAAGYTATPGALDFITRIEVQTGTNNLTVRSAAFTAASVPTKMKALVNVKEVDAAIAATDYTLECSRDSGTTWTAMTLTERYTMPTTGLRVVEADETDVSGQPSGTAPRWRFKTFNNKNVELHDVYLYWS